MKRNKWITELLVILLNEVLFLTPHKQLVISLGLLMTKVLYSNLFKKNKFFQYRRAKMGFTQHFLISLSEESENGWEIMEHVPKSMSKRSGTDYGQPAPMSTSKPTTAGLQKVRGLYNLLNKLQSFYQGSTFLNSCQILSLKSRT